MKLTIGTADPSAAKTDVLAACVAEGQSKACGPLGRAARALNALLAGASFSGKEGKTLSLPAPKGIAASSVLFVGLGKADRDPLEAARRAAGTTLGKAESIGGRKVAFVPPADDAETAGAAAEGFLLADYEFAHRKSPPKGSDKKKPETAVTLLAAPEARSGLKAALPRLRAEAEGVKLARTLGNEPSNLLTPEALADAARKLARERRADGMKCRILGLEQIRAKGMGAFLGVAQGSQVEPRFIHLSWKPSSRPSGRRIALVGKGLTFDSGGISIKPSAGMEDMKFDMCGAAAVIGLFRCLPDLGVRHEVHGFIAATDNMPSGSAIKPGDILKSMTGKTIEVINTDAEGRLTLVDAIAYALEHGPDAIVDLATLTGACAVALGAATGIMSNDDALRAALQASADATGERSWPLPLFDDYRPQLKSDYADIKNLGDRYGGALTAGLFLRDWVPEGLPWAHMDIAGSAWTGRELPYCGKGATGTGVRTLAHWLRHLGR